MLAVAACDLDNPGMRHRPAPGCTALALLLVASCAPPEPDVDADVLSGLPTHEAQRRALCERGRDNAVTRAFCGEDPPQLSSIAELQAMLSVAFDGEVLPGFSLVAHSSALPSRSVSSINPGSVIVSLPSHPANLNGPPNRLRTDGNVLALAFARGDRFVEVAVTPPGGDVAFYLLRYDLPCGDACAFKDLLTERTESGWTGWSLYDDEDLKDTVVDCLECHQPNGPGTPRIYRMQEPENPWTHWEAAFTLSGRVLLDDTVAAHGHHASVAGIPGEFVTQTNPVVVEDLVRFSNSEQPNVFDAPVVEAEVQATAPGQPRDNSVPGVSPSWDVVYDAAVRGEAIPPPYHDAKVTDAGKLAGATAAFVAFRNGDADDIPDIRRVFADSALAGMSHRPKPGLDGRGILAHACAQCHNPRLDQTLSRARFDALSIDSLDDAERAVAVARMKLPPEDRRHMPPRLFRDLSPAELDKAARALSP